MKRVTPAVKGLSSQGPDPGVPTGDTIRPMSRRMREPAFRQGQRDGLYEPHVAPVNRLVDELAGEGRGWLPRVAPVHGGVRARLLWVMRDPGPGVADPDHEGTGFLCAEDDDPTAERLCGLLERADIDLADTVPWNAYPWYVNRQPTAVELRLGAGALLRLLGLLPEVRVVLLFGREAERGGPSWSATTPGRSAVSGSWRPVTRAARRSSVRRSSGSGGRRSRPSSWSGWEHCSRPTGRAEGRCLVLSCAHRAHLPSFAQAVGGPRSATGHSSGSL